MGIVGANLVGNLIPLVQSWDGDCQDPLRVALKWPLLLKATMESWADVFGAHEKEGLIIARRASGANHHECFRVSLWPLGSDQKLS